MVTHDMAASEYLNQLLQDKTTITKMPKIFLHSERLLDEGIVLTTVIVICAVMRWHEFIICMNS